MLESFRTNSFKQEYTLAKKRGKNLDKLIEIMGLIIREAPLPPRCRNHPLHGNWAGFSECHIEGDWLLVYRIDEANRRVYFSHIGSHSDIF
ncbi:hypothetical protein AGMMS50230_02190 [Spirochaetia bacterium]|nr:hypothetical protein AGMMS50230_02190 [Spirochaetia bacterium]